MATDTPSQDAKTDDWLTPELRDFADALVRESQRLGAHPDLPMARRRAIAEEARQRWSSGGPDMRRVRDTMIPTSLGETRVRIFDPNGADSQPALIYLHGGGWMIFSLETHERIMRELAVRSGMVVVGIDYALAPEVRFPGALGQITEVVRALSEGECCPEIDPARLYIGGDSAGGNLSVATALTLRDEGRPDLLKGLLLFYAVVDRVCSAEAVRRYGGPENLLTAAEMEEFWTTYLADDADAQNPLANLSQACLDGLPPVASVIAGCDVLAEQNLKFAGALERAGVSVDHRVFEGACHSFIEAAETAPTARDALQYAADWLRRQAGR
ncbi:alpha/beta hydrolase [Henriciella aquimarina]|uniref:alpha/beta hydrolase n=1 Tax=Henriciella aquimarina TaxID=545261 RepID=UPI000A00AC78|nr:alpha/beta hydrolase [Henriciella aquimarina]